MPAFPPLLLPSFSLLLPLPTVAFFTTMAKRKATAEELEAQTNLAAIREGRTERKTAFKITRSIIRRLRGIRIRC